MDDRLRIRYLEERLEAVTREKMEALAALDAALGLYSASRLHREASPESLLEEAAPRIRAVVPFHSFGFYTVGEGFPSFVLAHAQPESAASLLDGEKELLVEDGTFSWAIERRRAVWATASRPGDRVCLHVLSAPRRVMGMFVGLMSRPSEDVPDISLVFLSVILNGLASMLQNQELFALVGDLNGELVEKVALLHRSEEELDAYRRSSEGSPPPNRERYGLEEDPDSREAHVAAVFDSSVEAIVLWDRRLCCLYANRAFLEKLDLLKEDVLDRRMGDLFPDLPEQVRFWSERVRETLERGVAGRFEDSFERDGCCVCMEVTISPVRDAAGEVYAAAMIYRDVTERRAAEERVRFLSYYDPLTRLYNRRFFEEEARRLDVPRQFPLTVLIGDVDALKLTNDAFGHQEGDRLLAAAADVLRRSTRKEDILARWGGDEFILLLPRADQAAGEAVIRRIEANQAPTPPVDGIPLSIAFGAATKTEGEPGLSPLIREAEEAMYGRKMRTREDRRRLIVGVLLDRLRRGSVESEEHVRTLRAFGSSVAERLGLPEKDRFLLDRLCAYHDLGMIGLPPEAALRPGPLSEEEWVLVRKHPELGYRIAQNAPLEMAEVAELILAHQERFDGTGYPQGLAGDSIPLAARIFAVADAAEAMTRGRPWRRALPFSRVRAEILAGAGTRFDPEVVRAFLE